MTWQQRWWDELGDDELLARLWQRDVPIGTAHDLVEHRGDGWAHAAIGVLLGDY